MLKDVSNAILNSICITRYVRLHPIRQNQIHVNRIQKPIGKNGMIQFSQPWCIHCTSMRPTLDEVAEKVHPSVFVAVFDCSKDEAYCDSQEIKVYPTIQYYINGKKHVYERGLNAEDMTNFAKEKLAKCDVQDKNRSCSKKEASYVLKWTEKPMDDRVKEWNRLKNMSGRSMTFQLKLWLNQRISILDQLVDSEETCVDDK